MRERKNVRTLTFEMVPRDVLRIAAKSIGEGALESTWRSIEDLTDDGAVVFYLLLRVVEGDPVGFALFHYERMESSGFSYVIGIIDAVCTAPAYRGQGYGAMLTFNVLKRMSIHGVNRIELVLKSAPNADFSAPMGSERFLFDLGFKKVAYLHNHWAQDSMNHPYDCPVCHERPDSCVGVLMAINET